MGCNVIKNLFSTEEITELLNIAEGEMAKHPFPGYLHPGYGTLRPQRLQNGPIPDWLEPRIKGKLSETLDSLVPVEGEEIPYFIYYPVDTLMHPHIDTYHLGDYWKVGILLKQDCVGGIFKVLGEEIKLEVGDLYVFHANKEKHEVTKVTEGQRLIISMGYVN